MTPPSIISWVPLSKSKAASRPPHSKTTSMDDFTIFTSEPDRLFKQVAAHYDAPAFARRARRVHEAFDELVERCRLQRDEWLHSVRLQTKKVATLLNPATAATVYDEMVRLAGAVGVALPDEPVQTRPRRLRHALMVLNGCIDRFNRRWTGYLATLDLSPLNRLREDYNRYYVLEKECALRSPRLARIGFVALQALTHEELAQIFPLLPRVQVTRTGE